jgi:hypothetical protein
MDLTYATLPGAVGDLHFDVGAFTGWDWVANLFFSADRMRRRVGQKVLRAFASADPWKRITFTMPGDGRVWEVWRNGAVVKWAGGR